jgi:ABC-2 type transport system ATP-binding protein
MDVVEAVCDRVVVMNDGRVVADDAVHELVDVFRTQTYRVVLERPVTDRFRRDVAGEFGVAEWTDRGDQVGFETTVDDETGFYALVDRVRRAESTLVSVDAVEPDLEDVFLELVEGDR